MSQAHTASKATGGVGLIHFAFGYISFIGGLITSFPVVAIFPAAGEQSTLIGRATSEHSGFLRSLLAFGWDVLFIEGYQAQPRCLLGYFLPSFSV